jgi:hypothetical protein
MEETQRRLTDGIHQGISYSLLEKLTILEKWIKRFGDAAQ